MRHARRGQAPPWPLGEAAIRRFREPRTYTRYPHYPQVDSPFTARIFVTLSVRGRDNFPATGDRLPSHSPSGHRAGRLRAAGRADAEGRAADEAAARRKLRACPLANAKAACFVKRPRNPGGLRARGGPFGTGSLRACGTGRQDTGSRSRTCPTESGLRPRAVTGGEGASASCPSGRTGSFGFRELRNGRDPGLRSMDLPGGTRASAPDPAASGTKGFGRRNRQSGKKDFGPKSAKRRTARASALTGSPRGNRTELRLLSDSGGSEAGTCPGFRPSKPPVAYA
jgi:hypothetical protein